MVTYDLILNLNYFNQENIMLISIDWIRDFTDVPNLSSKDLYTRFTLATAEVEDVISMNEHLEKIVVAQIISFEKHPDADKLKLVTFKTSEDKIQKVICGASNVRVGIRVPYAPIGVKLPNGLLLEAKKIRGIASEGMLCSEEELGFVEKSEGIMELSSDAVLGMNMLDYFKIKKDILFDIDNKSLTHRPDLWGHFGIAREFSAIFETPLKNRFNKTWQDGLRKKFTSEKSPITIKFENKSAGLSYLGLSLKNIKIASSPPWLVSRLKMCGIRSINNMVDISNYVMLELGMPLHIFDRDLIDGSQVIVKKLNTDTIFKTLDGIERNLSTEDTVICDVNKPLVLAGIMGGANSGVNEKTKNIFIEVANWKAAMVRRTSTRLGLRTDSSQRFEKSLDSQLLERTLLRTLELILELCPDALVVGEMVKHVEDEDKKLPLLIETKISKIKSVLGIDLNKAKINSIFEALDFQVEEKNEDTLLIHVPSYRATKDIELEADLIEEIGRVVGYDNISPLSPLDGIAPTRLSDYQKIQRRVRDFMVLQGKSYEIMTYPLIGESLLKKVLWPSTTSLKLINSISEDHDLMRPSLIPSLLQTCEINSKYGDRFRFFELGKSYFSDPANFSKESLHLGVAFFDKDKAPFVELSNIISNLLLSLNITAEFIEKNEKFKNPLIPSEWIGSHPFQYQDIRVMGKIVGGLISVHPLILKNLKIKGHMSLCVFDLSIFENFSPKEKNKYKPLNKFPISSFDWTVVTSLETQVAEIILACKKVKLKELKEVQILDVFKSDEKKFITVRATLFDEEKTLSSELLKEAEHMLIDATEKAGFYLK